MAGYKHNQLKNRSFEEIQILFDNTMKWIDSFVPMDSEVVEGSGKNTKSSGKKAESSKKRIRKELDEESTKRQKLEDDAEKAKLKLCLEIVLRDDKTVNVESLSTKYPIVDWKTHILAEDKIQDVLDLYRLVMERFEITSPEGYDRLLWGDLITLFEPKRKYPLTQEMLSRMLSRRLEVDHECEMAYELLRFTRSQFKKIQHARTNSQAEIVSEEQLVLRANRLVIKKNNQRVASDSHITDTMLRFVVEILRHHKLYNPVSLIATMPPPDLNNTYIQPPSEIQILAFIKTLGYDEDPETKLIVVSKMVATRLDQPWRAILSVLNRCHTGKDSS
ncbi:hypothetical protein Tco_0157113 [Tanacetum coccineum]